MRAGLWLVAPFLLMLSAAGAMTPEEAVGEARGLPEPDWRALLEAPEVSGKIADESGSTEDISALREGGQAKLFTPGRADADACWSRSDPRCLAVQEVDRAAAKRPTVDVDPSGGLMAGYDEVVGGAADWLGSALSGTGSGGVDCQVTSWPLGATAVTETCDVRSGAVGTAETCVETDQEILSRSSRWQCRLSAGAAASASCQVPVVLPLLTEYEVSCLEGQVEGQASSCPVTVSESVKAVWQAACTRPLYRVSERVCVRRLTVVPVGSCDLGSVVSDSVSDWGALGEDGAPGLDTLWLSYACADSDRPALTMATDSVTGGAADLSLSVAEESWDLSLESGGNTARFVGSLSCQEQDCVAEVTMSVYLGSGADRQYLGQLFKRLVFTRWAVLSETEYWDETCADQ